jgi:peroxidase
MSVEESFAQRLYKICPTNTTNSTTVLDIRSPNVFDNKYFVDLVERQALFTSDHSLLSNSKTKKIVHSFANNQTLFFQKFRRAIIKMGQVGVLTGKLQGEIRSNCSALNPPTSYASTLSTLVDDAQILEL